MINFEGLVICKSCLGDNELIKQMLFNKNGVKNICSNCNKIRKCVDYKALAIILKRVVRTHFTVVEPALREWERDNFHSSGDTLQTVLKTLVGSINNIEKIIDYICEIDAWDVRNGDTRFFDTTELYIRRKIYSDLFHQKWAALVTELKTSRRFFSDNARKFFDLIFEDIESLVSNNMNKGGRYKTIDEPIVRVIPIGEKIYRARKAIFFEDVKRILANPEKELSPPPSKITPQGRMNAQGVSIFYGAFDAEACKAEMRSSIGNFLILGTFKTKKILRILDFKRLESNVLANFSYFKQDAELQIMRSEFLSALHSLISSPVSSGQEDEYLITQVLAEYLAYVREKNFDGISFESTQMNDGTNIVIFPKVKVIELKVPNLDFDEIEDLSHEESVLENFGIEFLDGSAEVWKTTQIKYVTTREKNELFLDEKY